MYHIANIYELMGDNDQATEWYLLLLLLINVTNEPLAGALLSTFFSFSHSCSRYLQLLGLVPTDPGILQKVGTIFDQVLLLLLLFLLLLILLLLLLPLLLFHQEGDKQQAYQYHFDSYKNFPSNLEVIDWLGSYFIEMQVDSCGPLLLPSPGSRESDPVLRARRPHAA